MKMNCKTVFNRLNILIAFAAFLLPSALFAQSNPTALIRTSMGDIKVELYADKAPISVENFISYASAGYYDGTIFHRVIGSFMIQGGGFTPDMQKKSNAEPIQNEASNGLKNKRGTLAMARTGDPHSATAQFFINVDNNEDLNYTGQGSSREWGYAVFGRVVSGMNVVDSIRYVPTTTRSSFSDVPTEPVTIEAVEILQGQ
jgi:peptidyl-prolyl cis-trans isomerase B (cyclophilin B)